MTDTEWLNSEYPVVMGQAATRLISAEESCQELMDNVDHESNWKNCEFIALQIRKFCELLLLGSTLAHLREGNATIDPKKWRPKEAFGELSKLSDHPLQVPIDLKLHGHESGHHQVEPISTGLPFSILNSIYGICGDALHIPSAKKVLSQSIPPYDVPRFQGWMAGFRRLMLSHALVLPELHIILLCTWSGTPDAAPSVFALNAMGESTVEWSSYPEFSLLSA